MKKILLLIMLSMSLVIFSKAQTPEFFTTEYTSLTIPQIFDGKLSFINAGNLTTSLMDVNALKHDNSLLPSLPLVISAVTIYQTTTSGALTLATNSISAKDENYVVIYDFTQSQQISLPPQADGSCVSGLIGITVRMTAKIHSKKKGINLSNLFGVGLSASQDKLIGTLEVKAFGMSSQKINELIPVPSDLTTSTVQNALSAVATIKSHIYDSETRITPLWLAFNISGNNVQNAGAKYLDFNQINNQIQNYKK
jgi:hypothetical protein